MRESEFEELLRFIQERMRETGLGAVNERIVFDVRQEPRRASELVDEYLRALESEWYLGSAESSRAVLGRLREVASTEDGGEITGIELELSPADRDLFGQESIDLFVAPERQALVDDLRSLRGALLEEREEG